MPSFSEDYGRTPVCLYPQSHILLCHAIKKQPPTSRRKNEVPPLTMISQPQSTQHIHPQTQFLNPSRRRIRRRTAITPRRRRRTQQRILRLEVMAIPITQHRANVLVLEKADWRVLVRGAVLVAADVLALLDRSAGGEAPAAGAGA